ncbi:NAD(P)H dehydrogenase (quinone) [Stenotrophomonas sp. 2619]|uniref:NAD(P)H-dependent oxidoreductase n=1 Tax=Stenotrophomonas sp. 2619 TaxID=3156316 RepID=UPI003397ABB4
MSRSIVILLGHPDRDSLCGALAERYQHAALAAGHTVQLFALGEIDFDPILRHGYRQIQPLEPGLEQINTAIAGCEHLVLVYPTWWGGMPALLKGFFDRAFLPGVAFRYRADSVWWDRLLAGRSARVITTLDTPPWYFRWVYRMPGHQQIRRTILEFCGIRPVKISGFGPVRSASAAQREAWLQQAEQLGRQAR